MNDDLIESPPVGRRANSVAFHVPAGTRHALAWTLLINAAVGGAFASYFFTKSFLDGSVSVFRWPEGDIQQYLTGAKFFIHDAWRFPLFVSSFVERSYPQSMVFTDCIPLFALTTKLIYKITGYEIPFLAWWYVLVVVAQPISFALLLWFGGVRSKLLLATGGLFSLLVPTFLYRVGHAALFGHFAIITAMALYFASVGDGRARAWPKWIGIAWPMWLLFCSTINLYLLAMAGVFFAAALAQATLRDLAHGWIRSIGSRALYGAGVIGAVGALMFVFGFFVPSYKLEDMGTMELAGTNLISPFVPQLSAIFANSSTILDTTGLQYEGYNYFGAGMLILILFAIAFADRRPMNILGRHPVLVLTIVILMLFSLSRVAYAGKLLLWSYTLPDFVAVYRDPGRFIWPVTYFILFLALSALDSWRPMWRPCVVIASCLLLQWQDTRLLSDKIWNWGHITDKPALTNDPTALRDLIAQHEGVYTMPDYGCSQNALISDTTKDIGWYAALEHKPINTIYFSRRPIDENCSTDETIVNKKLQQSYLVVIFYDRGETYTPISGFTCAERERDGARICVASRKTPLSDTLIRELFETH